MKRRFYSFAFSPLAYLQGSELSRLSARFLELGLPSVVPLHGWWRRGAWAVTLPVGVFSNDFRPGAVTQEEHVSARSVLYTQHRDMARENNLAPRPHDPNLKAATHEGMTFYHLEVIRFLRTQVADPAFLNALYTFLLDAAKDRTLITPKRPRAPFVPHALRKQVHQLTHANSCRGPGWTPEEDAVLHRWFGMHTSGEHAGRHASLTVAAWQRVLDVELSGRRTRQSVQNRFVLLNELLLKEFLVDGYVPITRVQEYMSRAVGERPRLPPTRPKRPKRADPQQRRVLTL